MAVSDRISQQSWFVKQENTRNSNRETDLPLNRTAVLKESTVDTWLKDYASKAQPNYAQAYIAYMNPRDYVRLTTTTGGRYVIDEQTTPLDEEKFKAEAPGYPVQMTIDTETGNVMGHEGRHRSNAV